MTLKRCLRSGLRSMSGGAIEIITGKERRRRWSTEAKLRIVGEAEERGACIKAVAARHDVYPSLLFYWRRQVREGRLGTTDPTGFVPVRLLASSPETTTLSAHQAASDESCAAGIDITLPDGTRLHIRHASQLPLLRPVIAALRG
jgi:transposase